MDERLDSLKENINRWREHNIGEYWLHVGYIGMELNRFGDHELAFAQGKLWHYWHKEWREIKQGSDFWLFSVPGGFAWTRDILTHVLPSIGDSADALKLRYNAEYGYVEFLQVAAGHRDAANFTFEVKGFGLGIPDNFHAPSGE